MKNPRFEEMEDVIEDEKGWRRRGDFKSEEDWQNNANPKPESATVKRWQGDQKTAAATRQRAQSPGGSSPGGGSWQGRSSASQVPSTPDASPAPSSPWHDGQTGGGGGGGEGSGGSSSGSSS